MKLVRTVFASLAAVGLFAGIAMAAPPKPATAPTKPAPVVKATKPAPAPAVKTVPAAAKPEVKTAPAKPAVKTVSAKPAAKKPGKMMHKRHHRQLRTMHNGQKPMMHKTVAKPKAATKPVK